MFQDPTSIAISGGTGIAGWSTNGGNTLEVVTAPAYSQYPMVGVAQAYTSAVINAIPIASLGIEWLLDGVEIVGATSATYTPVAGDVGGLLSVRETWTNPAGTVVTESPTAGLVTPSMVAATSHKYIDPTLGVGDGGPFSEGAAYTPSFPLGDGTTAPAGTIHSTCKAAYDAASGNGHRYYCRKGYYHDPVGGVFFTSQFTRSNTLFSSYGPLDAEQPVLDAVVYLSDATGWTPHGSITGAWNYPLTGVTAGNSSVKGRLWVGRQSNGNLFPQRSIGTGRRRAASLSDLSLTNDTQNAGLWYVTAGSPSVLTVMADVSNAPPVYWDGIGLVFDNLSAGTARGIMMRNGASGNRVFDLGVQGTTFKPLGLGGMSVDSVCNANAFVHVATRSFIGDGLLVEGANASRTITNTYVSDLAAILDSSVLENDEGSNDFSNSNPISVGGFTNTTYLNNISYRGHSVHTVFDCILTSNEPPVNLYIDGVSVEFLTGSTDGRAFGGFVDGGYFKNFTITGACARSQWGGINFEVAYGVVSSTNTNKTPRDQYQAFKMVYTGNPTATPTANFSIHDVDFYMADTPNAKSAIWFESNPASFQSAANAVEVRDCRAFLADTQGFVVRAANLVDTTPWLDQNIHDNTVVNASLVGQNFSTANSGSSPPTYTTQPLNGFFGCSNNVVVAA